LAQELDAEVILCEATSAALPLARHNVIFCRGCFALPILLHAQIPKLRITNQKITDGR